MTRQLRLAVLLCAALASHAAFARDNHIRLKIQDGLNSPYAAGKLNSKVRLFWGDQKSPTPLQTFGTFTANKKTNALNKSDEHACELNFASAVIALQERAGREGGNAVVDIHSVYRNEDVSSDTEYVCGAGAVLSGVALRGTVVKLP